MAIVPTSAADAIPTNLAPAPALLAYTQGLGLERVLGRRKRGIANLVLTLLWLILAWRGSGRPEHLDTLDEPFLIRLLGLTRLPCARTLRRSLVYFSAKAVRASVEHAYRAELPRRAGRVWVAIDAHQVPYWGRGQTARFTKGWSGSHSRRLRGYRLYLAVDPDPGQVITFLLARGKRRDAQVIALLARRVRQLLGRRLVGVVADCGFTSKAAMAALVTSGVPFILGFARSAPIKRRLAALSPQQRAALRDGSWIRLGVCPWHLRLRLFALGARTPTDQRGPWVYVTSLRSLGPRRLAATYRQRWRASRPLRNCSTAMISIIWSGIACIRTRSPLASASWPAIWPSASRFTNLAHGPPSFASRMPVGCARLTVWACSRSHPTVSPCSPCVRSRLRLGPCRGRSASFIGLPDLRLSDLR